mmetsp:Transcript_24874/g.73549  ORF Transcript_24874/g.73549 Transcript_24874/m.73549 type:complete len:122 (-) Transcript_24874:161-526(-)
MATAAPAAAEKKSLGTEEIQQLLEENYVYIKAIVDGQNLGRMQQMQEFQGKLQANLMLLASVADGSGPPTGGSAQPVGGSAGGALPADRAQPMAPGAAAAPGAAGAQGMYLPGGGHVPGQQ